jgi:hypothetical protein
MTLDQLRPYLDLDGLCRSPVFIIGSPRSGTTALGHALNQHSELWASKESYMLHQLYGLGRAQQVWSHHQRRTNPSWLRAEQVERAEFLGFLGLGINALYSSRSDGRRWVDPTPLNTLMIEDLAEMFPGAAFVHLLRDGRPVVHSMGGFLEMLEAREGSVPEDEMPEWTRDFGRACETWSEYVETARRFEDGHRSRCLTVRNEDLAADPHATLARIHRFLGIADESGPASFLAGSRINSSFQGRGGGDAGWSEWRPGVRRQFADLAGRTLVRAGYVTEDGLRAWVETGVGSTAHS